MTKPPSPRPLSIKVIAISYFFVATWNSMGVLLREGSHEPEIVLGFRISEPWSVLYYILAVLLNLYLGLGIWRLRNMARKIAIGSACYNILNIVLSFAIPSSWALLVEIASQDSVLPGEYVLASYLILLSVISGLIILFLIKRKSAFVKKPTTSL